MNNAEASFTVREPKIKKLKVEGRELIIPRRVTIETLYGCNLSCIMCPIRLPAKRAKGQMEIGMYREILDSLVPFLEHIEMMDLFGLGEPLLDPFLYERIRYAKLLGFRSIGISTNADLLTDERQRDLLESGIDNVIISIDGATAEIHESIRVGSKFDTAVANSRRLIKIRDQDGYATRVVVRFIKQNANRDEWDAFKALWLNVISRDKGDEVSCYDVHAWGDATPSKDDTLGTVGKVESVERAACFMPFEILYILADGSVVLCSEDWYEGKHTFGNVKEACPIEVFNSKSFNAIREVHLKGEKNRIPICSNCTMLYSNAIKQNA